MPESTLSVLRGLLILLAGSLALEASPLMSVHTLDALAEADALIVGRVVSVEKGVEVFPPADRKWQHPVFEHVAEVEILRFYSEDRGIREQLDGQARVRVGYRAENPLGQGGVFGGVLWPEIRVDEVRVFGVRSGPDGFRLWLEEGRGAVPPAQEALLRNLPASDGIAFLERELVNGLASGDAATAFKAARYADAAFFTASLNAVDNRRPALEHRLTEMLAGDLDRARMAAAALLASQGSPRPSVADLRARRPPRGMVLTTFHWLLIHALELLPEENADALIIQALLDDLPALYWSTVVNEFAHHPALDAPLADAIARRKPDVLPLLEALVRKGRADLTPSALMIVREQMARPDLPAPDWFSAARLVLNHGSDEDFALFLGLVLRAQAGDPGLYRALWNAGAYDETAARSRMLRFLAIFLSDDREAVSGLRYSEMAAHRLTFFSGDRFGLDPNTALDQIPLAERQEAVQRARAWLQAQPTR
jgi:hypothetical protein